MQISHGNEGISVVECTNPNLSKYKVRWNIVPDGDKDEVTTSVVFVEEDFNHKPTIDEIKTVIREWYNAKIDESIYSGFVYNDMPVWLDQISQMNFKAAYDLAKAGKFDFDTQFKFGTMDEPIYYKFSNFDDLESFYLQQFQYVTTTLASGRAEKDAFDFTPYVTALSE